MSIQQPPSLDGATRAQAEATDRTPLPAQLAKRDAIRLRDYKNALAFYEGDQWAGLPTSTFRRIIANYTQTTIDKTSSYVQGGATVSIDPVNAADDAPARAAELALQELSDANALEELDYDSEIDCAVLGDGCYRVTWDAAENRVLIIAPDVAGVFPWPDPQDPTRFRRVAHRYQLSREDIFATWGVGATPAIETVIEDWTDLTHDVWIGEHLILSEANTYGFLPFVVYPNIRRPKRWWGRSDVDILKAVAQEINRELSALSNLMELSGFPIATLSGVDDKTNVQAFPGAIWELPKDARAAILDLLQGGAGEQHLNYLDKLKATLHDVSETPRTAFGGTEKDLSGVALEVDLQPLLQKVDRKRRIRRRVFAERAGMALRILDQFTASAHSQAGRPVVSWASPTPRDRQREATIEGLLVGKNLTSIESSIERLGDPDPEKELQRIESEIARGIRAPATVDSESTSV